MFTSQTKPKSLMVLSTLFMVAFIYSCKTESQKYQYNDSPALCSKPAYSHVMRSLYEYAYFDLPSARSCAEQQNKPLYILFTAHTAHSFAFDWLADKRIKKLMEREFVFVELFVDEWMTEMPVNHWIIDGEDTLKSMGAINQHIQLNQFESQGQPYIYIADHELNKFAVWGGYKRHAEKDMLRMMNTALDSFASSRP